MTELIESGAGVGAGGDAATLKVSLRGVPVEDIAFLRENFNKLTFHDPAARLRELWPTLYGIAKPPTALLLDKRAASALEEEVDAFLFAFGFGGMTGMKTIATMWRKGHADALMCAFNEADHFGVTHVQVKGVRDEDISGTTLNEEIAKLAHRYPTSKDLIVVLALHMSKPYPLTGLEVPKNLNLRGLYILSSPDPNLENWQVCGDLLDLSGADVHDFKFPATPQSQT